jgi:DNA mismatch endonuclease (patch repair protein)
MVDVVPPHVRSRMMSGIRGKNTKPEIVVRKLLFAAGYRFRLHRKDLPGVPDIVMPGRRVAIFVHGCFWHLHKECYLVKMPATRSKFWKDKLEANVSRDSRSVANLRELGWRVLSVWECATRDRESLSVLQGRLCAWIDGGMPVGDIGG